VRYNRCRLGRRWRCKVWRWHWCWRNGSLRAGLRCRWAGRRSARRWCQNNLLAVRATDVPAEQFNSYSHATTAKRAWESLGLRCHRLRVVGPRVSSCQFTQFGRCAGRCYLNHSIAKHHTGRRDQRTEIREQR
jgi:hypothetical protein